MIKICFYEGYKAEEVPKELILEGERVTVDEIVLEANVYNETVREYERLIKVRCGDRYFELSGSLEGWDCKEVYCEASR
ncbi:hypothetical protein GX441_03480 [bacterium]|nr:hypothetical protein [bacterium]